jgi:hypothetical protein
VITIKVFLLALVLLHVFVLIKNGIRMGWKLYVYRILLAIDQAYNVLLGGFADETISSRCARGFTTKWYWRILGNFLNWLQADHILKALESERLHSHLPIELR